MPPIHIAILAAGKGTRMKSARPKMLHRVAGRPMVEYVLKATRTLFPDTTTIVIGHQADALAASLTKYPGLTFVVQEPQLGTGHALMHGSLPPGAARAFVQAVDSPGVAGNILGRFEHLDQAGAELGVWITQWRLRRCCLRPACRP